MYGIIELIPLDLSTFIRWLHRLPLEEMTTREAFCTPRHVIKCNEMLFAQK